MTIPSQLPSPQNTLVILLGADSWPHHKAFQDSPAFSKAAHQWKNYFLGTFKLPLTHLLDLFNTNLHASNHYLSIKDFLRKYLNPPAEKLPVIHDILLLFIGHAE